MTLTALEKNKNKLQLNDKNGTGSKSLTFRFFHERSALVQIITTKFSSLLNNKKMFLAGFDF